MAKNVRSFTEEQEKALCHLTSLHILDFCYCSELISLPKELHRLSSIKKLSIKACPGILSLPEKGLPASLQELYVSNSSTELKEQCRKIKNVRCVYVDRHARCYGCILETRKGEGHRSDGSCDISSYLIHVVIYCLFHGKK